MALSKKTGKCSICKKKGPTDWHHIISQAHAKKTKQFKLLSDPNNVTELCRACHNQTTASMVRKRLTKEGKPSKKTVKTKPKSKSKSRPKAKSKGIGEMLLEAKKKSKAKSKSKGKEMIAPGYKKDMYGRIVPKDAMDYARDRMKK